VSFALPMRGRASGSGSCAARRSAGDRHRCDADHGPLREGGAAGNTKGGYGFYPLQAHADETREALGALLRPGNAGAITAVDRKTVLDLALAQIPAEYVEQIEILVRADSAGATHELADHCYEGNMRFSFATS
jgi:hypothetical protein